MATKEPKLWWLVRKGKGGYVEGGWRTKAEAREYMQNEVGRPSAFRYVHATETKVRSKNNPRRKISKGALSKILDSTWRSAKVRVHKGEAQIALYGKEAQKILKKLTGAKNPRKKRRRK